MQMVNVRYSEPCWPSWDYANRHRLAGYASGTIVSDTEQFPLRVNLIFADEIL